ncbi:MAG: hypothetical protein HYU34_03450 [Candidatus Omnitrophica bacterium]|nr:hypothetical protein [Candidatus Omnitrophota bacterium]
MSVTTQKRIKHLARYFGILGTLCLLGYGTGLAPLFLFFVGPPILLSFWLRTSAPFLVSWIPNNPFFNNVLLLYPVTLIYFGLAGFQLKNILNERGRVRFLILTAFVGFLFYIHRQAAQELFLYWDGSKRL